MVTRKRVGRFQIGPYEGTRQYGGPCAPPSVVEVQQIIMVGLQVHASIQSEVEASARGLLSSRTSCIITLPCHFFMMRSKDLDCSGRLKFSLIGPGASLWLEGGWPSSCRARPRYVSNLVHDVLFPLGLIYNQPWFPRSLIRSFISLHITASSCFRIWLSLLPPQQLFVSRQIFFFSTKMLSTVTPGPIAVTEPSGLAGSPNKKRKIICFSGKYVPEPRPSEVSSSRA